MDDCLAWFWMIVFITQFSNFWVMSYRNWKHILGAFSFHNYVFNDIFVIKITYWISRSESAATFDPRFFFSSLVRWVGFLHLLFFLFPFTLGGFFFFLFFSLSLSLVFFSFFSFFFPGFGEFGYWGLKNKIKNKKVKAAPSYRYGAHKQLKILSDGAKRVGCREFGYW